MKNIIAFTLASAAIASAQTPTSLGDGTFKCDKPNAAYCAGDSLGTDIIIRCNGTAVGQPGRCSNNLAGYPPLGASPALCYQTSPDAGDAACEKNCIVYAAASSFTLPTSLCTPSYTPTTTATTVDGLPRTTTIIVETVPATTTLTTKTVTPPTSDCKSTTTYIDPPHHNTTITRSTIFSPSSTRTGKPPVTTAGAATNKAMGGMAVMGFVAAYLL